MQIVFNVLWITIMLIIVSRLYCDTIELSNAHFNKLSQNKLGINLFKIELPAYYDLVPMLVNYLSETELQRAEKYHFVKDKNRFIICRSLLKILLAQTSGLNISEIQIEKDENKKPYLSINRSIHFNVSHAENFAIIAISKAAVGIDVEYLNKDFDYSEILSHVFNNMEIETILNSNNKDHTFYKYWTRKEAIVKATGKGISDNLPLISSSDGCHSIDAELLGGFQNMNVLSFNLDKDYIASLAFDDNNYNSDKISIYSLPTSLEDLMLLGII